MAQFTITIKKLSVYDEVSKSTAYSGAKAEDDSAYERIFATDANRDILERFWAETCSAATAEFKPFISNVTEIEESRNVDVTKDYVVTLLLSNSFDANLKNSMENSLFSFFVNNIVSKWLKYADKTDAPTFANDAATAMLDVKAKLYYRKKPTRKLIPKTS